MREHFRGADPGHGGWLRSGHQAVRQEPRRGVQSACNLVDCVRPSPVLPTTPGMPRPGRPALLTVAPATVAATISPRRPYPRAVWPRVLSGALGRTATPTIPHITQRGPYHLTSQTVPWFGRNGRSFVPATNPASAAERPGSRSAGRPAQPARSVLEAGPADTRDFRRPAR